jgi:plasmid stabilization system protein ParE
MEIVYQPSFQKAYETIIRYIAQDHLINAQRFGNALLAQIDTLKQFPEMYPASKHSDNPSVRDMVFKGYTIVYQIDAESDTVKILDLFKWQDKRQTP